MDSRYFTFLPIALLACVPAASNAAPLVSIGDNADIFFNGSSSVRWQSNVFRADSDEEEDLTYILSPGFELNVGRGVSNADLSIVTRYDIIRYDDLDDLDTETFHIRAIGSYETSRLSLNGELAFNQEQSSTGQESLVSSIDDLIETDNTLARISGEYQFSPKFSFGAGIRYSDKEYTSDDLVEQFGLADREQVSIPLDLFYELTPKIDLSAGYTYSSTDVSDSSRILNGTGSIVSDYESDDHFLNVGARGMLLPKLSGFFKVGYRFRDVDNSTIQNYVSGVPTTSGEIDRNDDGTLGLDADLTWYATPKLSTNLLLSHDFGVGGEGQATEVSTVRFRGNYSLNSYYALSGVAGYTLRDYTNSSREDDQYELGLRLTFSPDQHWRFSAGYTYSENESNLDSVNYDNHTIDLIASLRY